MCVVLLVPALRSLLGSGARALSAYARAKGHDTRLVFLPADVRLERDPQGYLLARLSYPRPVLEDVITACDGAGLVGISVLSFFFEAAVALSAAIRAARPHLPIVWGGVHPTVAPETCFRVPGVDFVCVGEGEQALVELAERLEGGGDLLSIPGIWTPTSRTPLRSPLPMDDLPAPDMDTDGRHRVRDIRSGRLLPLSLELFQAHQHRVRASRGRSLRSLVVLASRGCPHRCAYCANSRLHELYGPSWGTNRLSMDRLLDRLGEWMERFPGTEEIEFADDDFAARPMEDLNRFWAEYPRIVGRPFHYLSTPGLLTPDRVLPMREAGCFYFQTGIQSVASSSLDRYGRRDDTDRIRAAADLLAGLGGGVPPCYHVILDDPFETHWERLETLRFVNSLPRPFWLKRSTLVPYPGTPIHLRALEAGFLHGETERSTVWPRILTSPRPTPLNVVWRLLNDGAPPGVIDRLSRSARLEAPTTPISAALDDGLSRIQQARRWWHLGSAAVRRKDWTYLEERLGLILRDPRRKVPTSAQSG